MAVRGCTARDHDGGRCRAAVADGAPISLCTQHLLVLPHAHEVLAGQPHPEVP